MARPEFVVSVEDLRSGEKELSGPLSSEWLKQALVGTEAAPRGTPGHLSVRLTLNGPEVVVRGRVQAAVVLPCARTLDPVEVHVDTDIFLLLSPPAPTASPAQRPGARGRRSSRGGKKSAETAEDLQDADAARDSFDGERVVLDDYIREFIVLELPMFPLRSDLRSAETPAIESPPVGANGSDESKAIDPRLAPLAAIASRLRENKE